MIYYIANAFQDFHHILSRNDELNVSIRFLSILAVGGLFISNVLAVSGPLI